MSLIQTQSRHSEQGFTLVELAIVMVIIGILIGGILKGQELIANAKISGTVSQLKGLDAAMNTFEDKYGVKPGLMPDAVARLQGCATPCANVTGQTAYDAGFTAPTATSPGTQVFLHLNAADLISGIDSSGSSLTFGKMLPAVRAGGGMWVGSASAATNGGMALLNVGRPYAVLNGAVSTPTGTSGALSATTAAQIDRKLDDGQPNTGTVHATTSCSSGSSASNGVYDESNSGVVCAMASRVLN